MLHDQTTVAKPLAEEAESSKQTQERVAAAKLLRVAARASEAGWTLIALGMLVDLVAVGGMSVAIAWTSGATLVAALALGNLLLFVGVLVAYRGRLRGERWSAHGTHAPGGIAASPAYSEEVRADE
jgi:hypothetical protein